MNKNEDYIFTFYNFKDGIGMCKLSLIKLSNTPILCIRTINNSFTSYVSMITGKYFDGDHLSNSDSILLNNFMRTKPNFHDVNHKEEMGSCSNWLFMILQYLVLENPRTKEIEDILLNTNEYENIIDIPRFDIDGQISIPLTTEWVENIFRRKEAIR